MTTTMTIQAFINQYRVKFIAEKTDNNPNMSDMPAGSAHWKCIIRRVGGRRMTVYFSQGPAICKEPTAADVLDCLASDASGYDGRDFEEWASEYGYDIDSRRAEKTWNAIGKQVDDLKRVLGETGFNLLVNEVERL